MFCQKFADDIAKSCYDHFDKLPKKGKPVLNKEWTLLAGIVMTSERKKLDIISLTTGTKCLGFSQLKETGNLVSDSHAEVLARRGLLTFLYYQMNLALKKNNSDVLMFDDTNKKFELRDGIKFHLFISHVPCGDAAIFPKNLIADPCLLVAESSRSEVGERNPKRIKIDECPLIADSLNSDSEDPKHNDIYRTGAKCVENETQDPKLEGIGFHTSGSLRTKPGRGDPTWSMSCSDKIAMWNVVGMQGALLADLMSEPVYMASLVIGKCPFNNDAAQRAIIDRLSSISSLPEGYFLNKPFIIQSSLDFKFSKENVTKNNPEAVPCPSSIIWCAVPDSLEVSVNGAKQGVTKKNVDKPSSRISVCKSALFEEFLNIKKQLAENSTKTQSSVELTYLDCKQSAGPYQKSKVAVWKIFTNWKRKPEYLQKFVIPKIKYE
ncbi:hypothetical protein JTE90_017017 [Oedothorax gibbosus]|uniref:tRNA-specific adenosine deaminase 1 n=1 Tax=Oedothorax gibbosus TaxID=931172 RepID=A0AAV6UD34_9ARAC|nr:hypothetical protein JTE90_017017 [Oedothorax gibbosus]